MPWHECVTPPAAIHNTSEPAAEPLNEPSENGRRAAAGTIASVPSRVVRPANIAPPAARYAHAVATTGAQRWLHTSGVVPTRPDGSVADDTAEQARTVWHNISAMLAESDMTRSDIVSVTTYVVPGQNLAAVMAERDRFLAGHLIASTLVVVPELAQPAWKVEIAVIAAH